MPAIAVIITCAAKLVNIFQVNFSLSDYVGRGLIPPPFGLRPFPPDGGIVPRRPMAAILAAAPRGRPTGIVLSLTEKIDLIRHGFAVPPSPEGKAKRKIN